MDTRNTIQITSNRFGRALALIEALSSQRGMAIIHLLLERGQASFLDLTIHLGFDSDVLEHQLDQLCTSRLIRQRGNLIEGDWYEPDVEYLQRVTRITKQLAAFHV